MGRCGRIAGWAGGCALVLAAIGGAGAQAPRPAAAPKPAAALDPAFEAGRATFEALPEAERRGIQDALVWTGDYNSVVTGAYGRRTHDAVAAYAARSGVAGAGLSAALRAGMLAAGEAARRAARFAVKPDPASGVTIGVPERLLPKRSNLPGGTRWQSGDGRVTLDTKSVPPGESDLDTIFARVTAATSDRKVTYKLKRPDFLVVTAETATGKSYLRYAAGPEGIRGFTIGYDKASALEVDRLVIAIANSFVPFASGEPAVAAPPERGPVPTNPLAAPVLARGPAGTALVVGPNRVLTTARAIEGCPSPRIGGMPARVVASDPARNLALLEWSRPAGKAAPAPMPTIRETAPADAQAIAAFGAEPGGGVAVAPGEMAGEGIVAPLQPGSGGAPVLDRAGGLVGLVALYPAAPRLVAGVAPPIRYALVPGRVVGAYLVENGLASVPGAATAPGSLGAVTARLAGLVVGIECPR